MKLSKNFSLSEFTRSATADNYGIDNSPSQDQLNNLKNLCIDCLQPIHDAIGDLLQHNDYYIYISSGLRVDELNKKVGGSPDSFHPLGGAGDSSLYIDGTRNNALLFHVAKQIGNFNELVWEYNTQKENPPKNEPKWVHIGYLKGDGRRMVKYID